MTKYIVLKNPVNLYPHQKATFKELKQHNHQILQTYEIMAPKIFRHSNRNRDIFCYLMTKSIFSDLL